MSLKREILAGLGLCCAILFGTVALLFLAPVGYITFTYEDHIAEWAQVFLLLFSFVLLTLLAYRAKSCRLFFVVMAVLSLYVAGEEISWGQRLFNLEVPSLFQQHNLQHEFNLHNFFVGPYDTTLKRLIEVGLALVLLLAAYYAHPVSDCWKGLRYLKRSIAPPPPILLIPFFVCSALLELRFFSMNESEIAELLIAFSVGVYALYYWNETLRVQRVLSVLRLAGGLALLLFLAFGTTVLVTNLPHMQVEMAGRMDAGKKTFAHRYRQHGLLAQSNELYLSLYQSNAHQAWLLRDLAENSRLLDDDESFDRFNREAITVDLDRYDARQYDVSLNLSLFESYAQRGQEAKAAVYLQQAAKLAQHWKQLEPKNAEAAYWLGRVYQIVGKKVLAIEAFKVAIVLDPECTLYRRELYIETQR